MEVNDVCILSPVALPELRLADDWHWIGRWSESVGQRPVLYIINLHLLKTSRWRTVHYLQNKIKNKITFTIKYHIL